MKKPLDITIINTVYFHTEKVVRCLDSLFENTNYPFKLIVVCNGADKQLKKYLTEIGKRDNVYILWNKVNPGPAASENDGIKLANTKYIMITHSDMWFEKDWLTALIDCWNSLENPGYIFPTNKLGDGHTNFHPLMEREKYWSVKRDPAYKRAYSDFDWYWKFQRKWPTLCSYQCPDSIIYHECGGIRHSKEMKEMDKRLFEEDTKRYYKRWKIDAVNLYGEPKFKKEFLKKHKHLWEEQSKIQEEIIDETTGQLSNHFYQCHYCGLKKHYTDKQFFKYCNE